MLCGFRTSNAHSWRSTLRFKAVILILSMAPVAAAADVAKVFDYALGDHIVEYPIDGPEVLDKEMDGFGGQSFIKVKAPEATEIALTFRRPSQTLHYIEHDWIDRSKSASTALSLPETPEFQFGKTKVVDIQKAMGSEGFHYVCRQMLPASGGFLSFLSFEIPSRPDAVYTFILESSEDLIKRGWVGANNKDLDGAVLVATTIFRPSYAKDFWCAERVPYDAEAKLHPPREQKNFADFPPTDGITVDQEPWQVMTEPTVMISKSGAMTWGDRMHIAPNPEDCTQAGIMIWAHTLQDEKLLALEGKEVDGFFNLLLADKRREPIETPVKLNHTLYAPIDGREWPPFAIGSFVFGPFDFERLIETENDPSASGFSLEFGSDVAGLRDNFWTLEGLHKAGVEAIKLCKERTK